MRYLWLMLSNNAISVAHVIKQCDICGLCYSIGTVEIESSSDKLAAIHVYT